MSARYQEKKGVKARKGRWQGRLSDEGNGRRPSGGSAEGRRGGLFAALAEERGQGTTEYAILVGVLVVIAIMAIILFRDKVQELWNAIAEGVNSL